MAKLQYMFDVPFEYEVSDSVIKEQIKEEIFQSFGLEKTAATENFVSFMCREFFFEFLLFWQTELEIRLLNSAKDAFFWEVQS